MLRFETSEGALEIEPARLIVAGWTGRDEAALRHHMEELAAIGVAPPSEAPLFYRASAALMTQAARIEVLGPDTSGEAEPLLIRHRGMLWLGLASDHTDRALEAHSVAHSKQICAKVLARALWRRDSVKSLDALILRSWIHEGGAWTPYQEGTLAAIRPLDDLVARAGLGEGEAMICGTLAAIGGVRPAARFRMALTDPETGREMTHDYEATALPVVA